MIEVEAAGGDAEPLGWIAMFRLRRAPRDDEVCCFDWRTSA
ncbi:hypothetical protein ACIBF5_30635 [Micromonospora sp. NPDC050417]